MFKNFNITINPLTFRGLWRHINVKIHFRTSLCILLKKTLYAIVGVFLFFTPKVHKNVF